MGIKGIRGYHLGKRGVPDIRRTRRKSIFGTIKNRGHGFRTQKSGQCFIATAVYGDYNHPSVLTLRRFRDEKLVHSVLGNIFIGVYYASASNLADVAVQNEVIKRLARRLLDWLVQTLERK